MTVTTESTLIKRPPELCKNLEQWALALSECVLATKLWKTCVTEFGNRPTYGLHQ